MRFTAIFYALPHLLGLKEWYCAGKSALDARMREMNLPELRDFLDGSTVRSLMGLGCAEGH